MAATPELKMPGTPKPWMNRFMRMSMSLPLVGKLLGRSFALITVTGAKTGASYTTPVQYLKMGDEYVVMSQRHRVWWRNIRTKPDVSLTIERKPIDGRARIAEGEDAEQVLMDCLERNPRIAKFYGLQPSAGGTFASTEVHRLSEHLVVIVITTK